jgi:hypothetical protein
MGSNSDHPTHCVVRLRRPERVTPCGLVARFVANYYHCALMRITLIFLALAFFASCTTRPRYDQQIKESYRTGMGREEAHALLTDSRLLTSASRPATGWSSTSDRGYDAGRAAFHFERAHPDTPVHTCEVYWVGRHTSVPFVAGGVWFDYLYFDREDKLLGHYRRFVD